MVLLDIHPNIKKKINSYILAKTIPHIIFHGPCGSGKRHVLSFMIDKIYTPEEKKKYVIYINCAHQKGIRFIRDELKFFAKTNINYKDGEFFKSIILFNADKLTTDAQSALRRCIEQFSHTTRFFIIVENQNKLLRPILSRFCNIHVPLIMHGDNRTSLHAYKKIYLKEKNIKLLSKREKSLKDMMDKKQNFSSFDKCIKTCNKFYEKGYSCLNIMNFIEKNMKNIPIQRKYLLLMYFDKIRKEFRNEKLLMLYIIIFMRVDLSLENINEM